MSSSQKSKCPFIKDSNCAYPIKDRDDVICCSDFYTECYSYKLLTEYKNKEEEEKDGEQDA